MTYALKMAKVAAPAIDRTARRLHDSGYALVMNRLTFSFRQTEVLARFANEDDYKTGALVLAEEFRRDGWGTGTIYDNDNAITGQMIGLRLTHATFLTRTGDEVQARPSTWSVTGPMPPGNVYLDAETIEQLAQEAAEVVRDMLRWRSLEEHGKLPEGTYDLPKIEGNPMETQRDRDVAEHNDEPVNAPKPLPGSPAAAVIPVRPLNTVFGTEDDDADE
jgi:hypothetical protein